ncbi:exodeoxyribonuclease VII large subunit [Magnetospirillum sp. 64-120]|uniref:exodeoxyribonuclease VII large subunit n=1 Tax=Magnetospirillum sp. 64-120 TaxID=1895778 RepID=UPI0025BBDF49|nr:exodeoxyribonuclease VII large subunit [Magnetospirillum sp. 64-120]
MNERSNVPEFSVAELSGALKRTVEETFAHVRVRGEISGFKRHSSGHLYFALKDADAVLDAVCWRGQAGRLAMAPEDGMEVIATGRLTTYPGRSKYQMVVERMELAGQGALLKLLEDRRRKLAAEGLFEQARKKPIPFLPAVIGIVTSPTGAVIRDILHRLADRFPRRVLLWPVAVQGDGAAEQVARAIQGFNTFPQDGVPRPDLLIVARGGGSVEDLWAFNEEVVVRAAAESRIPLISAVGHETDTTLIDFASDLRAPTPTAAAEMAVPVRAELVATVADCTARLVGAMARGLEERRIRVQHLSRALPNPRRVIDDARLKLDDRAERLGLALPNLLHRRQADLDKLSGQLRHPRELLAAKAHQLDSLSTRLGHALKSALQAEKARQDRLALKLEQVGQRLAPSMTRLLAEQARRLDASAKLLESYSYKNVLDRGFAVVRDGDGKLVSAADAQTGAAWSIEFKDGKTDVVVGHGAAKPKAKGKDDVRQGSLL